MCGLPLKTELLVSPFEMRNFFGLRNYCVFFGGRTSNVLCNLVEEHNFVEVDNPVEQRPCNCTNLFNAQAW